jgi:hypothetical protein
MYFMWFVSKAEATTKINTFKRHNQLIGQLCVSSLLCFLIINVGIRVSLCAPQLILRTFKLTTM